MGAVSELQGAIGSSLWYRVATTRPALQPHVRLVRQHAPDAVWYVLDNPLSARQLRLDLSTYRVVVQLTGKISVGELWEQLWARGAQSGVAPPTQEQLIELLGQLYEADALAGEGSPDTADLQRRYDERVHKDRKSRYTNPMALRFRLFDPQPVIDALLQGLRAASLDRWPWGALWIGVVGTALALLPQHLHALSASISDRLLSMDNLMVLLVLFPIIKLGHELAHGLACRRRGGQVHELGVMFLVFYPVPYVDATSSNAFAHRTDRFITAAAGMAFEIAVAAIAFFVWLALEPGLARGIAFDVMMLAGLTTLLFNANPLMRYDGYYMLSDALNIPNLGQQSTHYWRWLLERFLLRDAASKPPRDAHRAPITLFLYGPVSTLYRLTVMLTIAWFIAQHYFMVGVVFAAWTLASGMAWPAIRFVRYLMRRQLNAAPGTRSVAWVGALIAATLAFLALVPMPYSSVAAGVVMASDDALVRAAAPGWVKRVDAASWQPVAAQTALLQLSQPLLVAQLQAQHARVALAQAKLRATWMKEPAKGEQLQQELQAERAALGYLQARFANTQIQAPMDGILWWDREADLAGRYVKQGEVMGFVQRPDGALGGAFIRFVVDPATAAHFESHPHLQRLSVRPTWSAKSAPLALSRTTPKLTRELPSAALGKGSGGSIAIDPSDPQGIKTLESWVEFDALPSVSGALALERHLGARVWVRLAHPWEPLAWRYLRALRRALLSQFQT
jgi:putative peptide zinc metalloprotease protein